MTSTTNSSANGSANDNAVRGASDDLIQPFQLEVSNFRGRIVRLNKVLNGILSAHDYPDCVSHLLAEGLIMTTILGGMLKFDGIFTIQASGAGPIKSFVCDMTSDGHLRGYVAFEDDIETRVTDTNPTLETLMGEGYLAFTVDHMMADRYQGIVELQPTSLIDSVQHYFNQSEQIKTAIEMAVEKGTDGWRAGAIMIQKLPEDQRIQDVDNDDWSRSTALLKTSTKAELIDSELPVNDLLYRLFHEEGVRVFQPQPLSKQCRCNTDRVMNVLMTLTPDDLDHAEKEGTIDMVCEFCSARYQFTREAIEKARPKA